MTRQLFVHRVVSLDVQLDERIGVKSLIDRIRWLVRQDDWFKLYTREISLAGGLADEDRRGALGGEDPRVLEKQNGASAENLA